MSEQLSAAIEPRHHSAQRNIESGRDLFVRKLFNIGQQHDLAVMQRNPVNRREDILIVRP